MNADIDHLTITAPTLHEGVALVERALGVAMGPGGAHPRMGTHNRLLRLSDTMFLEVIAIDPQAAPPRRPRWFALDARDPQPRLSNWVARVADIRDAVRALPEPLGEIEPITRDALEWWITIPADGSLPLGGAAPGLIEWGAPPHPASRMPESGCSLEGFDVAHPQPARVAALLAALGLRDPALRIVPLAAGAPPRLSARIRTPHGVRTIGA